MGDEYIHPLEKLRERGEEIQEKADKTKVHCPECDTTLYKDTIADAVETAEDHDESRHDNDRTTRVAGMLPPEFSEETREQFREVLAAIQGESDE